MHPWILASLLVAAGACDESIAGPTVPLDEEFVLRPGELARVEDISIRFVRVANDSRCPADAVCVFHHSPGRGGTVPVQFEDDSARRVPRDPACH
jgi:hypothetical protein